jgi:hypothetical protein
MLRKAIGIIMLLIAAAELLPTYTIAKGLLAGPIDETSYWLWKLGIHGSFVVVLGGVGLWLILRNRSSEQTGGQGSGAT